MVAAVGEAVADEAELALEMEDAAVEGDDAGRLLAAMLEGVQPERGDGGGIGMVEDAEDAAFLAQVTPAAPHRTCGSHAIMYERGVRAPAGSARVIRKDARAARPLGLTRGGAAAASPGLGGLRRLALVLRLADPLQQPFRVVGQHALQAVARWARIGRVRAWAAQSGILPCTSQSRNTQPMMQMSRPRAAPKAKPSVRSSAPIRDPGSGRRPSR